MQARPTPQWFREGVTYQIVLRSFSQEGNLKGAEKQLERLRDLGVNVLYLTPVNVADTDTDTTKWSPRQMKSGFHDARNPYRAGDYFHVDSEYGTDQDLKDFIDHAHRLNLKVLLDLIFVHCGPSAQVVRQHPEYFQHDENNQMRLTRWKFPMFDHSYSATRAYLRSIMTYYVADFNVDGFRCDVADEVPIDFWEEARGELDRLNRDLIIMAEGEKTYNTRFAFNGSYNWPVCKDAMLKVLHGSPKIATKGGAAFIRKKYEEYLGKCPQGTLLWNMTENHDWATDAFENRAEKRYGNACNELAIAFTFALDGVPFIFNGQEVCHDKRLSLFGHANCWIDWATEYQREAAKHRTAKIKEWVAMRHAKSALVEGKTIWLDNDQPQSACSFLRSDGKSADVLFVGNFSAKGVEVKLSNGRKYKLQPWGYVFE